MRRLIIFSVATTLAWACQPSDPRKPVQPPAPAANADLAAPEPGAVAVDPTAPEGPGPDGTAADPGEPEVIPDPRPLADGDAAARAMLEEPAWADPAPLSRYCEESIARAKAVRARLESPQADAGATVAEFNRLSLELDTAQGLAALLFNVSPEKPVRDAAQACEQALSKFATELSLDRALYDVLVAVDASGLDALGQRFVERSLRDFRRAGVDKDDATRARITEINARLVELDQAFGKNISEDVRSITVEDPDKLAGLPADWLASRQPGEDGKIVVTTDYPDFFPFQTYVKDDALRRELYDAFQNRAYPQNVPVITEVLALREEKARLLGHPHWASYAIEDKMAKSHETVASFIADIEAIARPRHEADVAMLLERKREDLPDAEAIEAHDRFYYVSMVQKEKFDFDPQSVRPYFSYPAVKKGILELYGELFDLEFIELEGFPVWHPTVDAYEMRSGGELVGRFFLDMHPRADKYKHAAAFPIQTGLSNERIPWASLVCNFPNPADGDGKALMEHSDVETYFHEFGHLIHHLLSRRGTFVNLAGFNVEWDFVEAPSQILEEWASSPEVLARFAKHVETGEPIPAELVERMKAAKEFGKGLSLMRQIFFTAYSFFLHTRETADLDLEAFTREIAEKYSPFPPDGSRVYANFGHLMGYSALYYTYQWSLSIAKDLFTRFEAAGLLDREVAMAYRKEILEPGGTRDAEDLVRAFLGRERNLDAYKRWIEAE